jgi:hypothetical protein
MKSVYAMSYKNKGLNKTFRGMGLDVKPKASQSFPKNSVGNRNLNGPTSKKKMKENDQNPVMKFILKMLK